METLIWLSGRGASLQLSECETGSPSGLLQSYPNYESWEC
jgi:hypothetical protein